MAVLEYIAEYRYWNRLVKMGRKISCWHGKWNEVSRQIYALEQTLHSECISNPCKEKGCMYYSMLQQYKKAVNKSEKIKNKLTMLEKKKEQMKSR